MDLAPKELDKYYYIIRTTVTTLEFGDCEYVNCLLGDLRIKSNSLSLLIEVPDFSTDLASVSLILALLLFLFLIEYLFRKRQHQNISDLARRKFSGLLKCSLWNRFRQ